MKRRLFLTTATGIAASTVFPPFAIGKPGKRRVVHGASRELLVMSDADPLPGLHE